MLIKTSRVCGEFYKSPRQPSRARLYLRKSSYGDGPYGFSRSLRSTINRVACNYVFPDEESAQRIASILHVPTISTLMNDSSLPWPSSGRVHVTYYMTTTSYCVPEDYNVELVQNRLEVIESADVTPLQAGFENRQRCLWRLKPTNSPNNYRGFDPTYVGSLKWLSCS